MDYGRTFRIVPSRGRYDVLGMRSGGANITNARPGEPGWLGNPYVAVDAGGRYSRQEASELFAQEFEKRYLADAEFRAAAQALVGKSVGYYKPGEEFSHLKSVQQWLAGRDFAADNGGAPTPTPEQAHQLSLAIEAKSPAEQRKAGDVWPLFAASAALGLGGISLAALLDSQERSQEPPPTLLDR
jgi:hypothetical protein